MRCLALVVLLLTGGCVAIKAPPPPPTYALSFFDPDEGLAGLKFIAYGQSEESVKATLRRHYVYASTRTEATKDLDYQLAAYFGPFPMDPADPKAIVRDSFRVRLHFEKDQLTKVSKLGAAS
jgi:hypothetical protein